MIVIADAGPLLHLHWVDARRWGLPPADILVVESVWLEVERHEPEVLRDRRLIRTEDPPVRAEGEVLEALDRGERAAVSLALEHPGCLVLCDERKARQACARLALRVIGSIGLILEAVREGRVDAAVAERALRELPERGRLRVAASLVDRAIAELHRPGL